MTLTRADPLAGCTVTEDGYAAMARSVRRVGAELQAPVGCVLEGGYALAALARSVAATLAALSAPSPDVGMLEEVDEVALAPAAAEARRRLAQWWPALAEGAY